ncbi:endoplasmic reticulum metallopeptidase 1 isoform X2 [Eupeodes corollae]|uniref:endoplasmic reticulum metallopeptidase 1 isoform X1 n=1 Tax=Eupeodes corollae TaxID=290404 RepID=UPI002491B1F2|nr:endoplasmic reticulum metallopeptidase 1 isoform X1 [Eupeodes corollae]XP_055917042.1 endoplasmic reticulum metallopeptidase 1 isoform X2 [Eupeodes corollae]
MKSKYENLKIIYNRNKFGWYWAPLFLSFWFVLFYVTVIPSFEHYPNILHIKDEANNPTRFIGERAENNLLNLTKMGPRVVGSAANEQGTIQFLLNEVDKIQSTAKNDIFDIEVDVQVGSGNYVLWKMVNMYQSIQNVIVRVQRIDSNKTSCLLLNSHFDSVPESSGAGDAGAMVVIMLEVLRVITKQDTPMDHCLLFLFNGAEENPLQGSHNFVTNHKWAKDARALINLDSAGSGNRELLFQSGPDHPWLMNYYGKHIVHPFASTIAEELFQHNFIPSDTDFRIFRDFGKIPGLDMAHVVNGYVYHTKYDKFNLIPRHTYQLTGDNVLELTKAFANAPELDDPSKHAIGHTVFYDFMNWILIYYSQTTGVILNSVACGAALISIFLYVWLLPKHMGLRRSRTFIHFAIIFGIQLLSVILAVGFTVLLGIILDLVGLPLSWYSQTWMAFGLYFCPMFFFLGILPAIYLQKTKEYGIPLGIAVQLFMHAHCLILVLITIPMICFGIRSAFLLMVGIIFYTLSVIINLVTCLHRKTFLWLIPHIVCQIVPYLLYTYNCYAFFKVFIPMQGRDGPDTDPEVLTSGYAVIISLLIAGFIIPILFIFRKTKTILSIFALICVIFIILAATPVGFPYTAKTSPQRYYVTNTIRRFYNPDMTVRREDSGYYVVPVDRKPHSLDEFFSNSNLTKASRTEDCETELMCGFPIYNARWLGYKSQSFWIPGPSPQIIGIPSMRIISKEAVSATNIKFQIEISGPDHMGIFIQPLDDANLVDWSFDKEPIDQQYTPPYFVYFSYGLDPAPLKFYLEFERYSPDWEGPTFDMAVIGHLVHHEIHYTDEFRGFIKTFPEWSYPTAWTSSYQSWRL